MARKSRVLKRPKIQPDPIYGSVLVSQFINRMMFDGKRMVAEKVFYKALAVIKEKIGREGFEVFNEAVENVLPQVEVKSRRVGGASYQIPVEVREVRRYTLAIRWLVLLSRARKERGMEQKLAAELIEASKNTGVAFKRKQEVHKMAEANKTFAHLRW